MNKLLAVLIAGLFAAGAYAQTPTSAPAKAEAKAAQVEKAAVATDANVDKAAAAKKAKEDKAAAKAASAPATK